MKHKPVLLKKIRLEEEVFKRKSPRNKKTDTSSLITNYNIKEDDGNFLYKFADIYFTILKILLGIFLVSFFVYFALRILGIDLYPPLGDYIINKVLSIWS